MCFLGSMDYKTWFELVKTQLEQLLICLVCYCLNWGTNTVVSVVSSELSSSTLTLLIDCSLPSDSVNVAHGLLLSIFTDIWVGKWFLLSCMVMLDCLQTSWGLCLANRQLGAYQLVCDCVYHHVCTVRRVKIWLLDSTVNCSSAVNHRCEV